jgi:predicted PurR-regulated permease PerM
MMKKSITPIQGFLFILVTIGGIVLLVFTAPVWRALLVAAILAYLLNPLVNRLERRWPGKRGLATTLVYFGMTVIIVGILSLAGALVWGQVSGWTQELRRAIGEISLLLERPFDVFGFELHPEFFISYLQRSTNNALAAVPSVSGGWFNGIADNLLWSLVALVSLFYFMRDGYRIAPNLINLLPPDYQEEAVQLAEELNTVWRISLRVQLIIFAIIGVLLLISTALIIWLFRRGWLPLSPVGLIILLVAVYAGIQQIDNLWLRPQYMGHALKLHPGVVVIALISALALTGVLGAIVIVPVLASLKVLAEYSYNKLLGHPVYFHNGGDT